MSDLDMHNLLDGPTVDVWMGGIPAEELEVVRDLPQTHRLLCTRFFRWLAYVASNELARRSLQAQGEPVENWKPTLAPWAFNASEAATLLVEGVQIIRAMDRHQLSEPCCRLITYAVTNVAAYRLYRPEPPTSPAPLPNPLPPDQPDPVTNHPALRN